MKNRDNTDDDRDISGRFLIAIFVAAMLAIVLVIGAYAAHFSGALSTSQTTWGVFGDFVGGTLNPVLAFLSLIALLLTIVLQNKELRETRKEMRRSADAQEDTKRALQEQNFENKFYSLLDEHNKALEKLVTPNSRRTDKSSDLEFIQKQVLPNTREDIAEAKINMRGQNYLCGSYFRILYHLLKFVATSNPDKQTVSHDVVEICSISVSTLEKSYTNIIRSFLNDGILHLLFVNCYCENPDESYWKFRLLVERYQFFEHMPFHRFQELNVRAYDSRAYGDNKRAAELLQDVP